MLEAAHQAKKEGIDTVVGYVERTRVLTPWRCWRAWRSFPARRSTTGASICGSLIWTPRCGGPRQLILVDELAHSNAPGCRHTKRYQDIEELLRAGMDVYTTVNVQHLESLNDLVSSITGVVVSERIPDGCLTRPARWNWWILNRQTW